MHDLDRTQPMLLQNEYEFNFESDSESGEAEAYEAGAPAGDAETMELASELLEVQSEEELEEFLGALVQKVGSAVSKAAGAVRDFSNTPTGQALVGVLKDAAKTALPALGTAVGTAYGGPVGGQIGNLAAQGLGSALGLELEGLSYEDQHFEAAQQVVRLATDAAQQAAALRTTPGTPQLKAKAAFIEAAKTYAPGLIRPVGANGNGNRPMGMGMPGAWQGPSASQHAGRHHGRRTSGRWMRRGDTLMLLGV
jgi:hypothetical protein